MVDLAQPPTNLLADWLLNTGIGGGMWATDWLHEMKSHSDNVEFALSTKMPLNWVVP